MSLDALAPIETFDAHGLRWEIRQLVSGPLASCVSGSPELVTWPVGFSVEDVRAAIEREIPSASSHTPGASAMTHAHELLGGNRQKGG